MFRMNISNVQKLIEKVGNFILKYENIGDSHLVDYFTQDHWGTMVDCDVRRVLGGFSMEELYGLSMRGGLGGERSEVKKNPEVKGHPGVKGQITDLNAYVEEAWLCRVYSLDILTSVKEVKKHLNFDPKYPVIPSHEFMSLKKSHEVEEMSPIVKSVCDYCLTNHVVDLGSGKGYLGSYLSLQYNLHVTGVDCMQSNVQGANQRTQKYFKYFSKLNRKKNLENTEINFTSVESFVAKETKIETISDESCVLIGLHTCGDLCSTILSMFVEDGGVRGACVVGCCYHMLSETMEEDRGFPMSSFIHNKGITLGRNKRMLSMKSPERVANCDVIMREQSEKSLFYRAILSVILSENFNQEIGNKDLKVGKIFAKSKSFVDYVRRSFVKLGLDGGVVSDGQIQGYLVEYEPRFKELVSFSMLRQVYAPAVETLILLDKICFLLESGNVGKIFLTEIFDRVKSPRCCAIIAVK